MAETAIADPPRFRWLKRGMVICIGVIVILAGVRWWWGWEAQRRLDALVAATHARGEPILSEDFKPRALAPGDNAAPLLLQAAAAIQWPPNFIEDSQTPEGLRTMWNIGQTNMVSRQLARAARDKPHAEWGPRIPNPMMGRVRPFNGFRSLANLLADSAQGEQSQGNDQEAVELLRDVLREGRALDDRPDDLVTHLVAAAIDSLATDTTLELSQRFRVAPATRGGATTASATPATPDQIRALIAELTDEPPLRESAQWCWHGEAAAILESIPSFPSFISQSQWNGGSHLPHALIWIVEPMFEIDGMSVIGRHQLIAQASGMDNLPAASALVRTIRWPDDSRNSNLEDLTAIVSHSFSFSVRMVEINFRSLTEHRAAATLLAICLYRTEHRGTLPRALADLVPRYLPTIPVDPMRADGGTFGYLPDSHPPIVYSVGLNGIDDGGSTRPLHSSYERWRNLDAVFPLAESATASPSVEAQNHQ